MISATAKVDMHCHSTASERSKLGGAGLEGFARAA